MSAYNELIKNFEKIRAYMREFYVYGFKSRSEYVVKSLRSYDDERRRMESWIGDYMSFIRSADGKNMFISIDSRVSSHNPFYRALKAKSFTDKDITLHFILFDILNTPDKVLTLPEIIEKMDSEYLSKFREPMIFDESTVRKKLKEYIDEGIISGEKRGRTVTYRRAASPLVPADSDALHFFSEIAPCGVIGSFLLDKYDRIPPDHIGFKHHYMTGALDSDVVAALFEAMHRKSEVTAVNHSRRSSPMTVCIVPLRIFVSVQGGRQHLLAYDTRAGIIKAFRIDYLSDVKIGNVRADFDRLRGELDRRQKHMWGVNCKNSEKYLEHVEFTVEVLPGEEHIIRRLHREKRVGTVEKIDETHYRFFADVYDTSELIPWIRTFICRITRLNFSDRTAENRFKKDIEEMYRIYKVEGGDET